MTDNEGVISRAPELQDHVENGELSRNKSIVSEDQAVKKGLDCKKFTLLVMFLLFVFPVVPITIAAIFGALFLWLEPDTTYRQGFLYVVSNLLGMANPLTDYNPSDATIAIILDMYVAITSLVVFGIMLNVVNLFEVPTAMNKLIGKVVKNQFFVSFIVLVIIIPLWNAGMCCIFGSILAVAENWSIQDGILYVFTNALGLGTALTDVAPETIGGAIVDIVVSAMALGYLAIFADYVVEVNPSRFVRRKVRSCLVGCGLMKLNNDNIRDVMSFDLDENKTDGFDHSSNKNEQNDSTLVNEHLEAFTGVNDKTKNSSPEHAKNLPRRPSK